jgi:hypothetical protein
MLHHCEAATKKRNSKFNHEAHEEHEGRKTFLKIRYPLRYPIFATFVVLKSFVEWRIRDSRAAEKFAQAGNLSTIVI